METGTLEKKIAKLPESLKAELEQYVDLLLNKLKTLTPIKKELNKVNVRGYGSLKGKIWMSEDFNEPLNEFGDYM